MSKLFWDKKRCDRVRWMIENDLEYSEIAEYFGVTAKAVETAVAKYHIKINEAVLLEKPEEVDVVSFWTEARIKKVKQLIDAGLSNSEISQHFNKPISTIQYIISKNQLGRPQYTAKENTPKRKTA